MPNVISGNAANVTTPLTRNVTGAVSAGGLIKITTSTSHLFSTSDIVTLQNVGGVPAANGTWVITVVDSTHFTLNGSTFSGTFTTGGTATDYSLTPSFGVVADGEQLTYDNLVVAFQALADRTQYLATRDRSTATTLAVAPSVFNVSFANNWALGAAANDNTSVGFYLVKAVAGSEPVMIDITQALSQQNGRTLASVKATISVGASHTGVPATLPEMRVYRAQQLGTTGVTPGFGEVQLASGGGQFFTPTPGSGAAWYVSGTTQHWSITLDQDNVIDTTQYRYVIVIFDESGANSQNNNTYYGFQLSVT